MRAGPASWIEFSWSRSSSGDRAERGDPEVGSCGPSLKCGVDLGELTTLMAARLSTGYTYSPCAADRCGQRWVCWRSSATLLGSEPNDLASLVDDVDVAVAVDGDVGRAPESAER